MPFAFALVGSVLIHLGALFGAEWELPGLSEVEAPATVDAVLLPPAKPEVPAVKVAAKSVARKPAAKRNAASSMEQSGPVTAVSPAPTLGREPVTTAAAPDDVASGQATSAPTAPTAPIALAGKGRVRYVVIRGEQGFVVGQSVHEWAHDGKSYQIRSVTETTGLAAVFKPARVVQTSQGLIGTAGLSPLEFRHEKVKGIDTATFDRERQMLRYEDKEVVLPEGAQDMLSLYYQAALSVVAEKMLEVPVATGRKLERYRFEPKGEERLTIAGKEWSALRVSAKSGADVIELWIAPELRNLPLKIRFVDNKGEIFDQIVETIDTIDTKDNQ